MTRGSDNDNILTYERIPKNNLYLFGVKEGNNFISDFNKLCEYADLLDIEKPNLIYSGIIKNTKKLEKLEIKYIKRALQLLAAAGTARLLLAS